MADYSENWTCGCCGIPDSRNMDAHKWDCTVPETMARARQDARLREEEKQRKERERLGRWDALDDEKLLAKSETARSVMKQASEIMRELEGEWHTSLDVIRSRGLIGTYLARERRG